MVHNKAGFFKNFGNLGGFKVFLFRQLHKARYVCFSDYHSHSFLRFGNGKLGAAEPLVFFRNTVEIDEKPVCQFTNSHRHTACAEVVATNDHRGGFGISEESLEFSFFGSVTLLHLCAAFGQRAYRVRLRGACGTAAAVAAGFTAKQNDRIARFGHFSAHVGSRSRAKHRTDFHMLCHVAVVIQFIYLTRCKTDLVTVGRIACGGGSNELSLRKLAFDGLRKRLCGVCRTGDTHRRIHV